MPHPWQELLFLSVVLIGCAGPPLTVQAPPRTADASQAVAGAPSAAGQLIVKFQPEATEAIEQARRSGRLLPTGLDSIDHLFREFKVVRLEKVFAGRDEGSSLARIYLLSLETAQPMERAAAAFSADPLVEYAEPNAIATIHPRVSGP